MLTRPTAVSHDLVRLEETLIAIRGEIRDAQMIAARLPNAVTGHADAKRTLAIAETMLDCLREEMAGEFLAASAEYASMANQSNSEVPF